jgi:hypothetical protein
VEARQPKGQAAVGPEEAAQTVGSQDGHAPCGTWQRALAQGREPKGKYTETVRARTIEAHAADAAGAPHETADCTRVSAATSTCQPPGHRLIQGRAAREGGEDDR